MSQGQCLVSVLITTQCFYPPKDEKLCDTKFDIQQWVCLISHAQLGLWNEVSAVWERRH